MNASQVWLPFNMLEENLHSVGTWHFDEVIACFRNEHLAIGSSLELDKSMKVKFIRTTEID